MRYICEICGCVVIPDDHDMNEESKCPACGDCEYEWVSIPDTPDRLDVILKRSEALGIAAHVLYNRAKGKLGIATIDDYERVLKELENQRLDRKEVTE
jgi:hypothetical protein